MAFLNKLKAVVQAEGARGIRQVLQKEGTKRFAQDLSANLSTRRYGLPALISAIAVDPVQGLLASGTFKGAIAVTGASETTCYLELEEAVSVKMIAFQPGSPVLVVVDARNAITVFDLIKKQRLFVRNARNIVTCMELLPGTNWLFHGLKDGTVDVFDVYRGQAVPYRIPNLMPEGNRHSMVVALQAHPKDNNQLLIAYNTGVALWNLKQKTIIRVFIFEIPPGAMGGVAVDGMFNSNESRFPHVTVVAWRPDGQGVVIGYDDGCLAFFDLKVEKPVLARTIHEVNVNIPGVKPLVERATAQFVPIYQITWCLNSNKEDTTLIVAGGTSSIDMYGLHVFEFSAKPDYRSPRRQHTLTTESDILDFAVLPRESPWYNSALDPIAVLILTNKGGIQSFGFEAPHPRYISPSCLQLVEPKLVLAKVYTQISPYHYNRLVNGLSRRSPPAHRIPLKGVLVLRSDENRINRDIMVTAHSDSSIRFWEGASFRPLHHLTVELGSLFYKYQSEIVAFEYSVYSQVLCVGFSNGTWVYTHLEGESGLSRQSSVATTIQSSVVSTIPEEPAIERVSETMDKLAISTANESQAKPGQTMAIPFIEPQSPKQPLQQDPASFQEPVPQPRDTKPVQHVQDPSESIEPSISTAPHRSDTKDTLPMPAPEDLEYLVPFEPLDSVPPLRNPIEGETSRGQQQPPEQHPQAQPPRESSPSLPPRPPFVQVSLPNGAEFLSAFKSNTHLGRINKMALSECGLVAVSDEFYSLSITDSQTGKALHVEDLKVINLDGDKPQCTNTSETDGSQPSIQGQLQSPGQGQDQSLQRVGVVLTSLQFVVSTTCDQDKVPSLLLVAGSDKGIYMIFAISPLGPPNQPRVVRKVETFQTKEQLSSIHTSVINVLAANPENASMSATSLSSVSTATSTTSSVSQPTSAGDVSSPSSPHVTQIAPVPIRKSEDDKASARGHRTSLSESSTHGSTSSKPSIYSTLREAQGKVMTKAQQRLNYLVCVSERGIRLHMNCTSRRIHKIDLTADLNHELQLLQQAGVRGNDSTNRIMAANVVYHEGACCILCLTEAGRILLFSVPKLELIPIPLTAVAGTSARAHQAPLGATTELRLPIVVEPHRLSEAVILPDGRIFVPILKYEFRMYSLWGHDRWIRNPITGELVQDRGTGAQSSIQLYDHGIQIPPRPTPAVSKSWFGGSGEEVPSQEDLDELLGGEHYVAENPILKRAGVQGPPGSPPNVPPKPSNGESSSGIANVMNETVLALGERGKKLGELGERTQEMQDASNDFLKAARELNAKNANKKWYEF
ncbi:hypothetical protein MVEG_09045 [Podila verticillata NRRL 6337]|nr:hypothetical protein MVEG_09045 [Podila verticillata NRRL 6337]